MKNIFVLLALISSTAFAADQKLGNVVAVKRTFTLNLAECERTYTVDQHDAARGVCKIGAQKVVLGETLVSSYDKYFEYAVSETPFDTVDVYVLATRDSAIVAVSDRRVGRQRDGSFASVRDFIQRAFSEIPGGTVSVVVHTVE